MTNATASSHPLDEVSQIGTAAIGVAADTGPLWRTWLALPVTNEMPDNQAEPTLRTRRAYDRLAAVWSSTTDEGHSTDSWSGLLSGH